MPANAVLWIGPGGECRCPLHIPEPARRRAELHWAFIPTPSGVWYGYTGPEKTEHDLHCEVCQEVKERHATAAEDPTG